LILAGTHLEPVPLVTGLTLLCFVQLALSLRDRVEKPDTDEAVTLPAVY
jgi:hypothetical protein